MKSKKLFKSKKKRQARKNTKRFFKRLTKKNIISWKLYGKYNHVDINKIEVDLYISAIQKPNKTVALFIESLTG